MRAIIFFSIFTAVFALMNYHIYFRFFARLHLPKIAKRTGLVLVVILFLMQFAYSMTFRYDLFPNFVYYMLGLAIGLSFMLFVVSLSYDILHLILKHLAGEPEQREYLKLILDVVSVSLMVIYLISGIVGGLKEPRLSFQNVQIAHWKNPANFRIVQLSDVHVGHVIKKDFVRNLVRRINEQNPDIVVITGDLADLDINKIQDDLAELKNLKSRYGTFFAPGNHEYFHGAQPIMEYLRTIGIHTLNNASYLITDAKRLSGNSIRVVGLADPVAESMGFEGPDMEKAFTAVKDGEIVIALMHQPMLINRDGADRANLVLSGHTHGGQIFPFMYLVKLAQPYLNGLHTFAPDSQIYVSRGTGFWGPPIRLLAPSEISVIDIQAGEVK